MISSVSAWLLSAGPASSCTGIRMTLVLTFILHTALEGRPGRKVVAGR